MRKLLIGLMLICALSSYGQGIDIGGIETVQWDETPQGLVAFFQEAIAAVFYDRYPQDPNTSNLIWAIDMMPGLVTNDSSFNASNTTPNALAYGPAGAAPTGVTGVMSETDSLRSSSRVWPERSQAI